MTTLQKEINAIFRQREQELAERIVERQYALQPEFWKRYGDVGREKSVRDVKYHFQYLSEALNASDPSLFADYVAWVKVLFAGLNFPDDVMIATLNCTREVFRETFPEEQMTMLDDYLKAGLQQMLHAPTTTSSFVEAQRPLTDLLHTYIEALLRGDRQAASRLVLDAVDTGASIKDIYLHVFQRSQYEIGRLWMTNQVSVAQEHYCTAATQLIMSQLYPYIFSTQKTGRQMVAACVGGELHEIGVRMVADFFEMDGWDTYYLGANTPASTIIQTLKERQPDVLGISATMTFHISLVEDLIRQIRAAYAAAPVHILVGGYPFLQHPNLWQAVEADGSAQDAQQAIELANSLINRGNAA